MHSQPETRFVSVSLPIGEKQETDGNQSGNGEKTKAASLCRNGNGANHTDGNGGAFFAASRFPPIRHSEGGVWFLLKGAYPSGGSSRRDSLANG